MTVESTPPRAGLALMRKCAVLFDVFLFAIACVIHVKVLWLNDLSHTLRQDPLELWIAIGVACYLKRPIVLRLAKTGGQP